ncbi:MAG TPA: hypothetical protein EYP18_12360 [Desulfobacterales bacterium]|nr:hypothetical protein [Desulfobacterales bacterium]
MIRLCCVGTVLLLLFIAAGCADKEQVYQGMYKGFSTVHELRMTEDPSYDPVQARDRNSPGYQEYKRDRELILNKSTTSAKGKEN